MKYIVLMLLVLVCQNTVGGDNYLKILNEKGESFLLEKLDISSLKEVEDANANKAIFVELTKAGQIKMKNFTENNIGGKISIYFGDYSINTGLPIVESSAMEKFHLSINNKDLIPEIVHSYRD